jgi:hypothetical protein
MLFFNQMREGGSMMISVVAKICGVAMKKSVLDLVCACALV